MRAVGEVQPSLNVCTVDDKTEVMNVKDWEDVDIEVTLDSGACRHVMPTEDAPGYDIQDSPGSRRGQNFIVGNGEKVPNEGQVHLSLQTDTGDGFYQHVTSDCRPNSATYERITNM